MEDVIEAAEAARAFDGQGVQGLLHHADEGTVPLGVAAEAAGVYVRQVLADGTEDDALLGLQKGLGQGPHLGQGGPQDVVGEALGALGADAWQLVELLDEPGDGPGGRYRILQTQHPFPIRYAHYKGARG